MIRIVDRPPQQPKPKQNIFYNKRLQLFLLSLLILANIIFFQSRSNLAGDIYIIYQLAPETIELIKDLNFDLTKKLDRGVYINVDLATDKSLENVYSNEFDRTSLQQLNSHFENNSTSADDRILIEVSQRIRDLVKDRNNNLIVIVVTSGTTDEKTIEDISQILKQIQPQQATLLKLYLFGLNSSSKLNFTRAFNPIAKSIYGSCTQDYYQCRILLNNALSDDRAD